jgi:hypothetical protein
VITTGDFVITYSPQLARYCRLPASLKRLGRMCPISPANAGVVVRDNQRDPHSTAPRGRHPERLGPRSLEPLCSGSGSRISQTATRRGAAKRLPERNGQEGRGLQIGSPDVIQAWNPPTTSVARCSPSRCKVAAARLDEYPSLQITITV